jgi:hypothetical protein
MHADRDPLKKPGRRWEGDDVESPSFVDQLRRLQLFHPSMGRESPSVIGNRQSRIVEILTHDFGNS